MNSTSATRRVRLILGAAFIVVLIGRTSGGDGPHTRMSHPSTDEAGGSKDGRSGGDDFRLPKPYPPTFQMQFVTNISSRGEEDGPDGSHDRSLYPIQGTLYYDWTRRVQRIDHGPGSYECVTFYQVETGCTLLFRTEGMYRILSKNNDGARDGDDNCCLDLANIGPPPPDWAAKSGGTWKGMVWDDYGQIFAMEWWFDRPVDGRGGGHLPSDGHLPRFGRTLRTNNDVEESGSHEKNPHQTNAITFHTARQVALGQDGVEAGLPLVFTFPSLAKGRQDIHFQHATMNRTLPNDSLLFELPEGCAHNRCRVGGTHASSTSSV